jgi:putative endonuclease
VAVESGRDVIQGARIVIPAKAGIQRRRTMERQFYVYILASKRNGTLYTGVTSDLIQRVWQHEQDLVEGFTKKYRVKKLVYYEVHDNAESAITREKQIKKWRRKWKLRLIEEKNPQWTDLYDEIVG